MIALLRSSFTPGVPPLLKMIPRFSIAVRIAAMVLSWGVWLPRMKLVTVCLDKPVAAASCS